MFRTDKIVFVDLTKTPIGGWYGLKKGLRGRFAMYIPPLMEKLGLAEVEHNPRNNRMRTIKQYYK
ncbi:DUF6855 family protein [Paenibacillus macquariensis]|uniref:DUF6855 family protein n=1 Tax=Paenibacillus macquariensis TaxID=948756 RepID=UPI00313E7969